MAARTIAVVSFAICFIFVGCSWRGTVANGGSRGGCTDNGGSCGAVLELSNRCFGALAGARFFFGFRPRLLGIRVTQRVARTVSRQIRVGGAIQYAKCVVCTARKFHENSNPSVPYDACGTLNRHQRM